MYRLDGGAWTDLTAGLVTNLAPSVVAPVDFCFSPTDPDAVYLCTASVQASNGGGGVHRFDGTDWETLPIPFATSGQAPFPQPFAPWFDPRDDGTLYVASNSHGLWVTHDAASPPTQQTWTEMVALPFLGAQRISSDPSDQNSAFVNTFGGGVWRIALPPLVTRGPTAGD